MPNFGTVDINVPLGTHYLNKYRRVWCKVIPQLYGGLVYYDLTYKQPMALVGMTDQTVSGWRRINRLGQYGCLQFDGVDDRASGLAGASMTNNYTLAATIYIDTTSNKGCFIKAGDTNQGFGIGIGSGNYDSPGNDLIALIESVRWQTLQAAIGTGWYRIVASLSSGGAIVAYVNGVQVYSEASGTGANGPGSFNFYVGGYTSTAGSTTQRYFRGQIDNAVLYNKVLTLADVKEDWRLEQSGFLDALNYVKRKPYLYMVTTPPTPVGITGTALWDVHTSVGATGSASWDVAAIVRPPGVLFADDFSAGAIGPAWKVHRGDWSQANEVISQTSIINDNPYKKIQIEGIAFPADVEIVARVRVDSQNSDNFRFGICLAGDQDAYGYELQVNPGVISFNWDFNHGSAAYKLFPWQVGVWYWLRFRQQSINNINTLFGKMWSDGDPEPADWLVTSTEFDAKTGAPGLLGGHLDGGTVSFDDVQVFDLAAGPAPSPVGITGAASWDIHQNIGVNYVNSWDVRAAVGMTAESVWDIREYVGITWSSFWDTREPIGIAGESTWNVFATAAVTTYPVSITGDSSWNILSNVYVNGIASWDVRAPVGRAGSARWDDRVPVSLVRSAIWANMIPVGVGGGTSWGVRTLAGIAVNAPWHVRERVGGEYVDRWNNRVLAGLEGSARWSLRGLAGLVGSAIWDVTTLLAHWPVGLTVALVWGDRRRLRLDALATWNDRLARGLYRGILYNINKRIGLTSNIKFHTRGRVSTTWIAPWSDRILRRVTYQDRWNVRSVVRLAAAGVWGTRARVGLVRSMDWLIRIPVGMSLSGTWRNRSRVAIGGACVWDLRARVGSNQHTYWNIRNSVRLTAEASWDLRHVVGVDGGVVFMTFLATRPGGVDFDPAAAAAYVEAQHGLNPWGIIPAPWSVRIDHDYPTPDAMRATRGSGKDGIPGVIIRIFNRNDYLSGMRQDPRDVLGRTLTGPDGRWIDSVYLIPGEYVILYEESARFPVTDLLTVIGTVPGREPPDLPPGDFNSPYYELDYYLSISHGWGKWGPGIGRGPSPVDHHFGGIDRYTFTRNGKGLEDVIVEIYPEADFLAGRTGDRYRAGWSRTNAAGRWDWPVNLYPGRYVAVGWHEGIATKFDIEVS